MRKFLLLWCSLTCAASAGPIAVFSNFGPGNTYNTSSAWTIGYPNPAFLNVYGAAFTPLQAVIFDDLQVVLEHQGGANQFVVSLNADSGNLPGAALESFFLDNQASNLFSGNLLTEASALHPLLNAGTQYWVVVSPASQGDVGGWLSSPSDQNRWAAEESSGWFPLDLTGSFNRGVFAVDGSAVPEPAPFWLVGLGWGAVVLFRARQRTKQQPRG